MAKTRNRSRSFGQIFKHLGTLSRGIAANAGELPHLEPKGRQLEGVVAEAGTLLSEQAIQTSAKQLLSRRLQALQERGETIGTFLRAGVREHYGRRSDKLVEFDILPFRGRRVPDDPPSTEIAAPVVEAQPADTDE